MSEVGRGEVLQMESLSPGGIPGRFLWRGRRHTVRAVTSVRPAPEAGRHAAGRSWIELRTDSGMRCLVSTDSRDGTWRMERVLPAAGG